jgi:arsenate reductase
MGTHDSPIRVLVLCTGNSIRSQMSEAFLARAGGGQLDVTSAGTHPWIVHPLTIRVLAERGIDWSGARAKGMTDFLETPFDVVVTVCDDANELCPVFPGGGRRVHHAFVDPGRVVGTDDERLAAFRATRDEIEAWAAAFAAELLAPEAARA